MNRSPVKKRTWIESFEALKRYKERHGNTLVPVHTCKEDPALGGWVNHQRSKKCKLSDEQLEKLNSIGFAWSCRVRNKTWNPMIDALKKFKEIHDHLEVPDVYQADQKLADFVKEQRKVYHRGQLSAARLKQLEEIGLKLREEEEEKGYGSTMEGEEEEMEGNEEGDQAEQEEEEDVVLYDNAFKQQYQKLVDFHIKFGHCRVPRFSRRGDTLGLWVSNLKRKDPETGMEPRCAELLDELDFFTAAAPAPSFSIGRTGTRRLPMSKPKLATGDEEKYQSDSESEGSDDDDDDEEEKEECAIFCKDTDASSDNDTDDEDSDDDKSDSESLKSSSSSSSDDDSDNEVEAKVEEDCPGSKKRRLSSISQTSSQAKSRANYRDERFMKQYQDLLDFKNENGHCRVPQSKRFKTLGGWVNNLRVMFNRDPVNGVRPDRRKMLDDVGFIWNAGADRPGNDARWEEQYKHLEEFRAKFGHCRVPQTGPHRKLGRWVATQRALFVKDPANGIRADRLKRLNDAEFTWDAKGFKGRHFYSIAAVCDAAGATKVQQTSTKTEAVKGESDATESDDDEAVAAQVDENQPQVKVEDALDAVATIPSEGNSGSATVPAASVAAVEAIVKLEDHIHVKREPALVPPQPSTTTVMKAEPTLGPGPPITVASNTPVIKIEPLATLPAPAYPQPPITNAAAMESKPLVKQVSVD